MSLKTETLKEAWSHDWLQRIETWLTQMEKDGKKPLCPACGDKTAWEGADAYYIKKGRAGDQGFIALTCACGCSNFIVSADKLGLKVH